MVKKAILIGINYKGSDAELNGCINDIKHIKEILINNCGYCIDNIKILTEEEQIIPTKENIEKGIFWLISNCMKGDTLFYYYSGHGAYVKDTSNDESDGQDEVIIPLDYEQNGVITDDWIFTNFISKIPADVRLLGFNDCCHSGTMMDLKYNYKSLCQYKKDVTNNIYNSEEWTNKFIFDIEKEINVKGNICFFSGCQDNETSADAYLSNKSQGSFSYCLIEFIKNNLQKMSDGTFRFKNGTVKLLDVLKEINARLIIHGFVGQNSQLSLSHQYSESTLYI
jgi:hypothetical protein